MLQAGSHYSHITVRVTAFDQTFILRLMKNRLMLNEVSVVFTRRQHNSILCRCPVIAIATVSVRLSVCSPHSAIPSKRCQKNLHCRLPERL